MQAATQNRPLRVRGYDLLGELGTSSTSQVFLARRRRLMPITRHAGHTVAIKVLRPEANDHVRTLFAQERLGLSAGLHRQIPSYVQSGTTRRGDQYVMMQVIDGFDLAQSVAAHGAMAPVDVAFLAREIAGVLTAMHAAEYVHRDIKLRNLMLSMDAQLYVTDLGSIALPGVTYPMSETGDVHVSPEYASPQAVQGETPDPSDDVFSLGIVIIQLLVRNPPVGFADIDHSNPEAIGRWTSRGGIHRDVIARIRLFAENVDKTLLELGVRCTHPNRAMRPTAPDVEHELDKYLQGCAPEFAPSTKSVGRHTKEAPVPWRHPLSSGNTSGGAHRNVVEETQPMLTIDF